MKNLNTKSILFLTLLFAVSCEENLDINDTNDVLKSRNSTNASSFTTYNVHSASLEATPRYDGADAGPIDLSIAKLWVQNYKDQLGSPNEIRSHYFGRNIIDKILNQTDCKGLRIYYALNAEGEKVLIISGVDSKGYNLLPASQTVVTGDNVLADYSWPCPTVCNPPSGDL